MRQFLRGYLAERLSGLPGKHSLSLLVIMLASLGVDDGLLGEDHKPVIKAMESCVFLSFHAKKKSYNLRDLDMLESAAEDFVHDTQTAFRSVLANGQYNKPKAYTCSTLTASTQINGALAGYSCSATETAGSIAIKRAYTRTDRKGSGNQCVFF
jgi:hypothetical protein